MRAVIVVVVSGLLAGCGPSGPSPQELAHLRRCESLQTRLTNIEMELDQLRIEDSQAAQFGETNAQSDRGTEDDFAQGAGAYVQCAGYYAFAAQTTRQRCDRVLTAAFNATLAKRRLQSEISAERCS